MIITLRLLCRLGIESLLEDILFLEIRLEIMLLVDGNSTPACTTGKPGASLLTA